MYMTCQKFLCPVQLLSCPVHLSLIRGDAKAHAYVEITAILNCWGSTQAVKPEALSLSHCDGAGMPVKQLEALLSNGATVVQVQF